MRQNNKKAKVWCLESDSGSKTFLELTEELFYICVWNVKIFGHIQLDVNQY